MQQLPTLYVIVIMLLTAPHLEMDSMRGCKVCVGA